MQVFTTALYFHHVGNQVSQTKDKNGRLSGTGCAHARFSRLKAESNVALIPNPNNGFVLISILGRFFESLSHEVFERIGSSVKFLDWFQFVKV